MLKNYRHLLTFLSLCACKEEPGTLNKEYVKTMEKYYNGKKQRWLKIFSKTELATIEIQGFFNELLKFDKECKNPDLKKLRTDPDVAQQILEGFLYLYDLHKTDYTLGIQDKKQIDFMIERLSDALLILQSCTREMKDKDLEKKAKYTYLLHRTYFILGGNIRQNKPVNPTIKDLEIYLENLFIEQYGSREKLFVTESGTKAANKISSLITLWENRKGMFHTIALDKSITLKKFEEELESKLIFIASEILINNGCILKEYDRANGSSLHPTYLMEVLKSLLRYNSTNDVDKYRQFSITDENNLRKFIFEIIWVALISTSDTLCADFQPNLPLYLKFDTLDLQHAFEVYALLNYFRDVTFIHNNLTQPDLSFLSLVFRSADYYYPPQNEDNLKPINIQDDSRSQYFSDKIREKLLSNNSDPLFSLFLSHIYRNFTSNNYAFCEESAIKFFHNLEVWGNNVKNFTQNSIPPDFISSLSVVVKNNSVSTTSYEETIIDKYFPSLRFTNNSLLKEACRFTKDMLDKGISVKSCRNFEAFAESVLEKSKEKYVYPTIKDVFNFDFDKQGIKVPPYATDGRILVKKGNIEKIIMLIQNNRTAKMTFGQVLMERMLNVCLLEALK